MYDKLLFKEIKDIPIYIIQECVSKATKIPIEVMTDTRRFPGIRQRERVAARQISMYLCRKYTKYSLAVIGNHHGGRDHATVLHAEKTINNLIDTKDFMIMKDLNESVRFINEWNAQRKDLIKRPTEHDLLRKRDILYKEIKHINFQLASILQLHGADKFNMIKIFIKNKVPLEIREKLLFEQTTKLLKR